jgi:ketosteroid isomerase-like protein
MDAAAVVEMSDSEVEWTTELIGTPVYRGHEGVRQAFRDVDRAWESWHTELVEILERGDTVFYGTRATARARATGITVEAELFYVAVFRQGKFVRFRGFTERSEALEAAGLSE